jgi:ribonuclease P protein component
VKTFGFSANEKLKSRKQIGKVFQSGRHFHIPPLRISWILEPKENDDKEGLQVGVGASGKHFKKAVDRNRIKRLLREAWRLQKAPLKTILEGSKNKLSVFIIFTGKDLPEYATLSVKVGELIDKLIHIVHEDGAANT